MGLGPEFGGRSPRGWVSLGSIFCIMGLLGMLALEASADRPPAKSKPWGDNTYCPGMNDGYGDRPPFGFDVQKISETHAKMAKMYMSFPNPRASNYMSHLIDDLITLSGQGGFEPDTPNADPLLPATESDKQAPFPFLATVEEILRRENNTKHFYKVNPPHPCTSGVCEYHLGQVFNFICKKRSDAETKELMGFNDTKWEVHGFEVGKICHPDDPNFGHEHDEATNTESAGFSHFMRSFDGAVKKNEKIKLAEEASLKNHCDKSRCLYNAEKKTFICAGTFVQPTSLSVLMFLGILVVALSSRLAW